MIYDTIVIGAGAAGLMYAAFDDAPGNKLILEKTGRPGQKLLMSGSGACNITHGGSIKDFITKYGDHGTKIRSCLYKHNNLELMKKLEEWGLPLFEREDGKVFPKSMKAKDILDKFLERSSNYTLRTNAEVTAISGNNLTLKSGETLEFKKLIIATGGASYPSTGSDGTFNQVMAQSLGIETTPRRPALTPIYIQNYPYADISGVSIKDVKIRSGKHETRGPLLFTHKGLSGPAVLHMSQYVKTGDTITVNFLPEESTPEVFSRIKADQPGNSKGIANYIAQTFELPKAFAEKMFAKPTRKLSEIGHKELENVTHLLTSRSYSVSGLGGWKDAMVTAGGVSLKEVNLKTMSLKSYPDIRVIGEALDINGDTGGYNLQFTYSSAMAALYN